MEQLINKYEQGTIERLFSVFIYSKNSNRAIAAFRAINRRLYKMPKMINFNTIQTLSAIYSTNCINGFIVPCNHYFCNGKLIIK
jgi:hypothetical protein